ncbi:MAG: amidase [SAR86 cluster bacterium]|uniref:Amidase n=1 Tax=SAR86 cluster bacterium TaxID=2030880 RepID=A0A2A4MUQ9_9GAMM|nr:MAG: amidase [SAR86 cluster bacterium]
MVSNLCAKRIKGVAPTLVLLALLALQMQFNLLMAAENIPPAWQRVDESAALARQSQHSNERMHFRLINSSVLDKNTLWQGFQSQLTAFGEQRYQALKPLIIEASIAQLQQAIAAGELSYEELVSFYLYRIRLYESDNSLSLNALIATNPEALTLAQALDRQVQAGSLKPTENSIVGMPILLKDNIGSSGMATTAGALALQENLAADAFISINLKRSGAIILGKTNLSEWAYFFCDGCPLGYSALGGQTLNPYGRLQFETGGSSSGSAVAVAANFAVAAVGTETSGSILSPASANSVVGLKPTTGALSRSGIVPISSTLDTPGPISRTVADAVLLFNAMSGFDEADSAMPLISADMQLDVRAVNINGMRLGYLTTLAEHQRYGELYTRALSVLELNSAQLTQLTLASSDLTGFSEFLGAQMKVDLASYLRQQNSVESNMHSVSQLRDYNLANPKQRIPYGQGRFDAIAQMTISPEEAEQLGEQLQSQARTVLDGAFAQHDLDILLSINNSHAALAALANYPALTLPLGYTDAGQPVGLTLLAPSFHEQDLINLAVQIERLLALRKPPVDYP